MVPAIELSQNWRNQNWVLDPKAYFYPTLYTYVLSFACLLFGKIYHPELIGRFLASLFGLFTAIPAYKLGRDLFSRTVGLIAAAFVCLGFVFVKEGRYPTPDSLQLFMFACGLWVLMRENPMTAKNALIGGLLVGLATGTKWMALIFAAPIVAILFMRMKSRATLLFGAATVVGFLFSTPTFLFRWREFVHTQQVVLSLAKDGLLGVDPIGFWGYFFYSGAPSQFFPDWPSLRQTMGLGWVVAALLSVGYLMVKSCREKNIRFMALGGGMTVAYLLVAIFLQASAGRIILPLAFCLVISLSALLNEVRWQSLKILLVLILLVPGTVLSFGYAKSLQSPDTRLSAAEWVLSNIPRGSKVLNFVNGPALPTSLVSMVQWPMFESRLDVQQKPLEKPSLERLRAEKIAWVIWNETLDGRISSRSTNPLDVSYLKNWKQFKLDLEKPSIATKRFQVEAVYSPSIQIFQINPQPSL